MRIGRGKFEFLKIKYNLASAFLNYIFAIKIFNKLKFINKRKRQLITAKTAVKWSDNYENLAM